MDKATIDNVVIFLKEALVRSCNNIDSIALFGPALKGTWSEESDIDLIIIS